jgi:plasmid stability protein
MIISMKTNTLQIREFPYEVNKALKIKAVKQGISFRALLISILTAAAK